MQWLIAIPDLHKHVALTMVADAKRPAGELQRVVCAGQGDGREFDYGIDYTECANCKVLRAENAFELAPYVCATDKPISELLGWGLTRPKTIAEGSQTCSFRFKKGGATNVPIPQSLLIPLGTKA